jgi:O-antigen/teichoic acid export membrane protein
MHFKFQETVPFLRVGGYQTGSKILDFISQESDIFIVGKMLGAEILGVYSLSKQIVLKLFSLINPIIVNVLSPLLSSIQNEKERVKKTFLKIIQYLAYLTFPIYFIIMVSSEEILFFLYGSSYVEASLVLSFLAVYYCLISLSNPVGSLQIATGRTDIGFIWTILRVFVTPMFIFLGAIYNIEGVAFSIALLGVLLFIPLWYIQIRPMANISLVEYFQQFYKPLIIFIILGFVVIILQQSISIAPSILSLISKILLSISLFIGILFIIDNKSVKIFYKFGSSMISKK